MTYCVYCGLVAHRCRCGQPDSRLHQFLNRRLTPILVEMQHRADPYKRAVPPQIKEQIRARLRANYAVWYAALVERYGVRCLNCGAETRLVIDHILPVAKGGLSEPDNLQLLCAECNRLKGKLVIDCRPHE